MAAVLTLGLATAGTASAALPTVPPFPTFGTYPSWLPANDQMSNVDHAEGSDTTLYVMQAISDLYSRSGLFPFSCQPTTNNQDCLTPAGNSGNNPNNTQSDVNDNFAATEELQGINDVGSGNGQGELCGTIGTPVGTTVDYARSSKPFGVAGCNATETGFGKDSVPAVDFQSIDPQEYGTPTGFNSNVDPQCSTAGQYPSYNYSTGAVVCTQFPSGGIGPVAAGWLPGDPYNCVAAGQGLSGTPCSGTPFLDVDNTPTPGSGLGGASSLAYRLWCQHGPSGTAGESQITDWGQLTNLSGSEVPGQGTPIGVPINVVGVNAGSGTAATFNNFAKSGIGSGNCTSTSNYNEDAASQGDSQNAQGPGPGNLEIALENDANQIGDFAGADWPATDAPDQATTIATSLYYMGYGAYNTNSNAGVASLEVNAGVVPTGDPTTFTESLLAGNGVQPSIANERNNKYPTSRTVFNIYLTNSIRASTGGFINWLCDTNPVAGGGGGQIQKGRDAIDGGNFDTDLTNIITGDYGFSRLTDATAELPASAQVTANGLTNPNGSCEATQSIASGGITNGTATVTLTAAVPSTVQVGWTVTIPAGFSSALPANTTVASVSGSTITLSNAPVAGTGGTAPSTIYFPGHPPVLAVSNPNS
ncbi:MAG: hypothetical protein ACLQRH_16615 [Acidimicrobiales bacterium]